MAGLKAQKAGVFWLPRISARLRPVFFAAHCTHKHKKAPIHYPGLLFFF
ncbi:MAG: hypothetical protein MJ196_04000 [Treponemataceae bacterium]|nr:hypothetical protein [Treponemataceae bacterium]